MKKLLGGVLGLAIVSLAACASSIIGTHEWFDQNSYGKGALATRASFDLSCPEADLQYVGVGAGGDYKSVGVSGCGKKVVYVLVDNSKWVLNSDAHAQ